MNELEEAGYRLILGQPPEPRLMSYNYLRAATEAAHRHMQKHEIDIRRVMRDVLDRRAR
jgi:hypothetical protein